VLIVDDIEHNRSVLLNLLTPIGFEIEEAIDGQYAVNQAATFQPDIILMDLRMPTLDGFEATRRIREQETKKKSAIIAISALAYKQDQMGAAEAGCDDFIAKPIQVEMLLQMMQKHLGEGWGWMYGEADKTTTELSAVFELPPKELTAVLLHYAKIGDVRNLRQELAKADESDSSYQPIIAQLSEYAAQYNLKKIAELLQPH